MPSDLTNNHLELLNWDPANPVDLEDGPQWPQGHWPDVEPDGPVPAGWMTFIDVLFWVLCGLGSLSRRLVQSLFGVGTPRSLVGTMVLDHLLTIFIYMVVICVFSGCV